MRIAFRSGHNILFSIILEHIMLSIWNNYYNVCVIIVDAKNIVMFVQSLNTMCNIFYYKYSENYENYLLGNIKM